MPVKSISLNAEIIQSRYLNASVFSLTDRSGHPTLPPVRRAAVLPAGSRQVQTSLESLGGLPFRPGLLAGSVEPKHIICLHPIFKNTFCLVKKINK